MAIVINKQDLPGNASALKFEGYLHEGVRLSFFHSDTPLGRGPSLHTHPYAEIFIVLEGNLTFTLGEETIEATRDQIVIVPPGTPHKFVNSGTGTTRHLDLHLNERMITDWLEGY